MADATALSQVTRVSLPRQSMFVDTPVYTLADDPSTVVFGLRLPVLFPANGDSSLRVGEPQENRLDLISHTLYGQPDGWWAIADVSGLMDPLAGVRAGITLRVPSSVRLPS